MSNPIIKKLDYSPRGERRSEQVKGVVSKLGRGIGSGAINRPNIARGRRKLGSGRIDIPTGGVRGSKKPTGSRLDFDRDGWSDEGTTNPIFVGLSDNKKPNLSSDGQNKRPKINMTKRSSRERIDIRKKIKYNEKLTDKKTISRKNGPKWLDGLSNQQIADLLVPDSYKTYTTMLADGFGVDEPEIKKYLSSRWDRNKPWLEIDYSQKSTDELKKVIKTALDESPIFSWAVRNYGSPSYMVMTRGSAKSYNNRDSVKPLYDALKKLHPDAPDEPQFAATNHLDLELVTLNPLNIIDKKSWQTKEPILDKFTASKIPTNLDTVIDRSIPGTLIHEWAHWYQSGILLSNLETAENRRRSPRSLVNSNDSDFFDKVKIALEYNSDEGNMNLHLKKIPINDSIDEPRTITSYGHVSKKEAFAEGMLAYMHPNKELKRKAINNKLKNDIEKILSGDAGIDAWKDSSSNIQKEKAALDSGRRKRKLIKLSSGSEIEKIEKPSFPRHPSFGPFLGDTENIFKDVKNWTEFKDIYDNLEINFFDYETTGLVMDEFGETTGNGMPTQFGVTKTKGGKEIGRFNSYMNPTEKLGDWSRKNLKNIDGELLTDEWLSGQISIAEAHQRLIDFVGPDAIFGVQNAVFDKTVLEEMLIASGIEWRPKGWIDTKTVSDISIPKWSENNQDAPWTINKESGEKIPSSSLKALTEFLNIDLGKKHHTADADAAATSKLMTAIIDKAIEKKWSTDIFDKRFRDEHEKNKLDKYQRSIISFNEQKNSFLAENFPEKASAPQPLIKEKFGSGSVSNESTQYRMRHESPDKSSGAPLHNLANGAIFPEDIYGPNAANLYGGAFPELAKKAIAIFKETRNKPDSDVIVYRAVPVGKKIQKGDWVSILPEYAKIHGDNWLKTDFEIVSKKVKAKDIFNEGNSILEFGYSPDREQKTQNSTSQKLSSGKRKKIQVPADKKYKNIKDGGGGDCFDSASNLLTSLIAKYPERADNFKLVHGVPLGTGGEAKDLRFHHAWVEETSRLNDDEINEILSNYAEGIRKVIEKEMGALLSERVTIHDNSNGRKVLMPREIYYAIGNIDGNLVQRYSFDEMVKKQRSTKHYGPYSSGQKANTAKKPYPQQFFTRKLSSGDGTVDRNKNYRKEIIFAQSSDVLPILSSGQSNKITYKGKVWKDRKNELGGDVYSFRSQYEQYPPKGPPGISYFRGMFEDGKTWVDCLLYRDNDGNLIGILNHYPFTSVDPDDPSVFEKKGNFNIFIDPNNKRKGLATALVGEAVNRYNVDLRRQRYSEEGSQFINNYIRKLPENIGKFKLSSGKTNRADRRADNSRLSSGSVELSEMDKQRIQRRIDSYKDAVKKGDGSESKLLWDENGKLKERPTIISDVDDDYDDDEELSKEEKENQTAAREYSKISLEEMAERTRRAEESKRRLNSPEYLEQTRLRRVKMNKGKETNIHNADGTIKRKDGEKLSSGSLINSAKYKKRHTALLKKILTRMDKEGAGWMDEDVRTARLDELEYNFGKDIRQTIEYWFTGADDVTYNMRAEIEEGKVSKEVKDFLGLIDISPVTSRPIYRGMRYMTKDQLDGIVNRGIELPLGAFSGQKSTALEYAAVNSLNDAQVSVVLRLERGVKAFPMKHFSPIDEEEYLVSGTFEVTGVSQTPVGRFDKTITEVEIRQKEKSLSSGGRRVSQMPKNKAKSKTANDINWDSLQGKYGNKEGLPNVKEELEDYLAPKEIESLEKWVYEAKWPRLYLSAVNSSEDTSHYDVLQSRLIEARVPEVVTIVRMGSQNTSSSKIGSGSANDGWSGGDKSGYHYGKDTKVFVSRVPRKNIIGIGQLEEGEFFYKTDGVVTTEIKEDVSKFNPNYDELSRFTFASGGQPRINLSDEEKREIISIASQRTDDFSKSVVAQFRRNGRLSDKQWNALNRATLGRSRLSSGLMDIEEFKNMSDKKHARILSDAGLSQRGDAEDAGQAVSEKGFPGLYQYALEHIGDLYHRAQHRLQDSAYGLDEVDEKITKILRYLRQPYGFEREVKEQIERITAQNPKLSMDALKSLGKKYADAHSKLPVYNLPAELMVKASMHLGNWEFKDATETLEKLQEMLEDEEKWKPMFSRKGTIEYLESKPK